MDRCLAWVLVVVLAGCSDDGTAASGGGEGGGSGTGDTSDGDPSRASNDGEGTQGSAESGATGLPGTTGGSVGTLQCEDDDDCTLVNDCCNCTAAHVDDAPLECGLPNCEQSTCNAIGLSEPSVRCRFGTCEIAPLTCNGALVACDEPAPTCGQGTAPSVVDGCWGPCVRVEFCDVVPSCDVCPEGEACLESATQLGFFFACEPIAPACEGTPTCACMGEACGSGFVCGEASDGNGADLGCSCPAC